MTSILPALWRDLRFGWRFLRRNPKFTIVAVATLALGIGVNTAIFSATYGIVLKPLPFPESSRLVELRTMRLPVKDSTRFLSIPALEDIQTHSQSFQHVAYYQPAAMAVTGFREPEALSGLGVSGEFFAVYGVSPAAGRYILRADTEPAAPPVAVLSHEYWQRSFGGDPTIVGTTIHLSVMPQAVIAPQAPPAWPHVVIGIMPPRDRFPVDGEVWVPLRKRNYQGAMGASPRGARNVVGIARLRDGTTLRQAIAELSGLGRNLAGQYPATDGQWDLSAVRLLDAVAGNYRAALLLLLSASAFVLVLACVNVGSLLTARSGARARDVAIRQTIGATRSRLVCQFLVEALLLASLGGVMSVLLAAGSTRVIGWLAPAGMPRLDDVGLSWPVLAYAVGVTCLTGALIGMAPAMKLTAPELGTAAKSSKAASGSANVPLPIPFRVRGLLIGLQIALAFPLVIGSSLALRSLDRLLRVDLGLRPDHVLTMYVKFSGEKCARFADCSVTVSQALERIKTVPGVEKVAIAGTRPIAFPLVLPIAVEGESQLPADALRAEFQIVTPEYFSLLGIATRAGRTFADHDTLSTPLVAVVNQTLSRQKFNGAAIGKRISLAPAGRPILMEIVGEVRDVRDVSPAMPPQPTFYVPLAQSRLIPRISLLVRTTAEPLAVAPAIRGAMSELDGAATLSEMRSLPQLIGATLAETRFHTGLLSVFAAIGLTLALVGIYGLISYTVSLRTHEFGVRIALGAKPSDIVRLVMRESVPSISFGVFCGGVAAFALVRFLRSLIVEAHAADSLTVVVVGVVIILSALTAYYLPARHAARPSVATMLRDE